MSVGLCCLCCILSTGAAVLHNCCERGYICLGTALGAQPDEFVSPCLSVGRSILEKLSYDPQHEKDVIFSNLVLIFNNSRMGVFAWKQKQR